MITKRTLRRELGTARQRATRYRNERDALLAAVRRIENTPTRGEPRAPYIAPELDGAAYDHLTATARLIREADQALNTEVPA